MSNLETLEILEGNTISPPKSASQCSQKLHWFFTWNNYNPEDLETLETLFKHLCHKFAFQEEMGKEGTHHIQGVISLKKRARWTEFGLPKEIHWEKVRNITQAYIYCTKEQTRCGKVIVFNYEIQKPLKLITPSKPWQLEILEIFKTEPNDRTVHWFWSEHGGVGKSSFAKYCVVKENCLFFEEGKKADIMNLIFTAPTSRLERIIIDIPRANCNNISYKSIESIKNGLIYSSKYEGGYKYFNPPHIIIFCNFEPQYDKLSADRWHVVNIDE